MVTGTGELSLALTAVAALGLAIAITAATWGERHPHRLLPITRTAALVLAAGAAIANFAIQVLT